MSRFLLICVVALACSAAESRFRVENGRVQVLAGSEVVAESPAEGLWSIACDWPQGWPAAWQRAAPAQVLREGEWTILRGEMNACGGVWALEDAYRMEEGVVRGRRRWSHQGAKPAAKVTLSVRWRAKSDAATALLPGILYYGNPSGARSGRVPVAGPESMFEEHRYPMPFASVEMRRGNRFWGAALHAVPSPAPYGNLPDQWWSLGTIGSELVALSGPCASNGKRSVIKGVQRGFVPYENAWLTVEPGAVIEKSYYLEAYPVDREGSGFEQPVRTSIALFRPFYAGDLPGFADILRAKYRYAKTRWREADGYAVFQKYVDRKFGVMGWTGQAEAPGYALQVLAPGLRTRRRSNWRKNRSTSSRKRRFTRAASTTRMARANASIACPWFRSSFPLHSFFWRSYRILAASWNPVSTSEASFVAPLLQSAQLFGVDACRKAAVKAAAYYANRHLLMREPYWGGTLDAVGRQGGRRARLPGLPGTLRDHA